MARNWDGFDAYLFDIDGTLLNCTDAVHYFGFCRTLSALAKQPIDLDGVVTHGNVDPAILRDALVQAGVSDELWLPHLDQLQASVSDYVEAHTCDFRVEVLPSVREVLQHLQRQGALLGVATGNLERVGWAKLRTAGLDESFSFGGFSDGCWTRTEVFAKAVAIARARLGNADAPLCVIGDTPADIEAAKANGLAVISVATGVYRPEQLAAAQPDFLVGSMDELLQSKPLRAVTTHGA